MKVRDPVIGEMPGSLCVASGRAIQGVPSRKRSVRRAHCIETSVGGF